MNHALNSHSICFCFNPHKHEKGDPSLSQKGRGKQRMVSTPKVGMILLVRVGTACTPKVGMMLLV